MRKQEDQHHTPEQVQAYLEQASEIAYAVPLTNEERVSVLPTLVTLLASKQLFYEQMAPMPAMAIPRNARH
jgi:hypothetical protein